MEALLGHTGDTAENPLPVDIDTDPGLSVMAPGETADCEVPSPGTLGSDARGPLLTMSLP